MNKIVIFTPWNTIQPLNRTEPQIGFHCNKMLQKVSTIGCRDCGGERINCTRKEVCGVKAVFPMMLVVVVTQSCTFVIKLDTKVDELYCISITP